MKQQQLITDKVIQVIIDTPYNNVQKAKVSDYLVEDLDLDSLDIVELIMSIECEFDIIIQDEYVDTVKTVGDLVKVVTTAIGD